MVSDILIVRLLTAVVTQTSITRNLYRFILIILLAFVPLLSYAQSIKFVQWWGEYLPQAYEQTVSNRYRSKPPNSLQNQDVDGDEVYNDAIVWYEFSLEKPLNPSSQDPDNPIERFAYRIDRPSAQFFGGIVARYTNVSDVTTINTKGEEVPLFNQFSQATIQLDGATPCSYSTKWPNYFIRSLHRNDYPGPYWIDMTVFAVGPRKTANEMSRVFFSKPESKTNFAAVFLWKKQDFINGGATINGVKFDDTSRLSVDITRFRDNVEEGRFVVQDGEQLWISEFISGSEDESPLTITLNPQKSRWAVYTPSSYDIAFDYENAHYVEHEFKDIQSVGVYFATYAFSHQKTEIAFDNFQVYATGDIPPGKGLVADPLNTEVETTAGFNGGTAVNQGSYEQRTTLCLEDYVDILGYIKVDKAHVGELADILVVAIYKTIPEDDNGLYYMLEETGHISEWDGDPNSLVAFKRDVTLQSEHYLPIYSGHFKYPGFVQVLFGYRLKNDVVSEQGVTLANTIVYSAEPIDMIINAMYKGIYNDSK